MRHVRKHRHYRRNRLNRPAYEKIFTDGTDYRATGVILTKLSADRADQPDLFGETLRIEGMRELYGAIDDIAKKLGKNAELPG